MKKTLTLILALCAVTAVGVFSYDWFFKSPALVYATMIGVPGPHSTNSNLPALSLEIEFDQNRSRVLTRQEDGNVISWGLKSGKPHQVTKTDSLFAYCRAEQKLLVSHEKDVVLMDLAKGSHQLITRGAYHHAAWRSDCKRFALAGEDVRAIELWNSESLARIGLAVTKMPVRNGLAMSPDGHVIAAAQGTYDDTNGHKTRLGIFTTNDAGNLSRGLGIEDSNMVLGMWKMVFAPDGQRLHTGSQIEARSGLWAISPGTGNILWGQSGFKSYWVRALSISPDGTVLVSGDEKGLLRGWDSRSGRKLFERSTSLVIQSLSFSDDGKKLAVALWDSTIGIVDLADILK